MRFTTSFLLTIVLAATNCLAQDKPSFPRPRKSAKVVKNNQFIVQYKDSKAYDVAKQKKALSTPNGLKVVKYIDTRNVEVVNFSSKESAKKWFKKNAEKIKYFEEGEYSAALNFGEGRGRARL